MSRRSRIAWPPGRLFAQIDFLVLRELGLAAAAVIGRLDFLDRARDTAGEPLASSAELWAALAPIIGRNAILAALRQLEDLGIVDAITKVERGERNFLRTVRYALDAASLSTFLAKTCGSFNSDGPELPNSGSPETPGLGSRNGDSPKERKKKETTPLSEEQIEEFVDAAVVVAAKPPKNIVKFRQAVRRRIRSGGPTNDDLADLAEFRRRRDTQNAKAQEAEAQHFADKQAATPAAREHGRKILEELRKKLEKKE